MLEFWELRHPKFGLISDVLSYNAVFDCFRLCPDSLLIIMIQVCMFDESTIYYYRIF